MAQFNGMDRFTTGKSFAHRKLEIQALTAKVTRQFKANEIVDLADLDQVIEHATEMKKAASFWNDERRRALRQPVKTP